MTFLRNLKPGDSLPIPGDDGEIVVVVEIVEIKRHRVRLKVSTEKGEAKRMADEIAAKSGLHDRNSQQ